jgi:hypothetical protein
MAVVKGKQQRYNPAVMWWPGILSSACLQDHPMYVNTDHPANVHSCGRCCMRCAHSCPHPFGIRKASS